MNLAPRPAHRAAALLRNKTRSFLTDPRGHHRRRSVISMVAVGEGAKARVSSVFAAMGTNMLIVLSGTTTTGGVSGGFGSLPTLTWDDLKAIRDAGARRCAGPRPRRRPRPRIMAGEDQNWTTSVTGSSPEFFDIRNWVIAKGSLFGDTDVRVGREGDRRGRHRRRQALRAGGGSGRQDGAHPRRAVSRGGPARAQGPVADGDGLRRRRLHPGHDLPEPDPGRPPEVHRRDHRRRAPSPRGHRPRPSRDAGAPARPPPPRPRATRTTSTSAT